METEALLIPALLTLMGGALGTLFWGRLNRLEKMLDYVMSNMATKDDIANMATKDDIAAIRSDLIKVALAVGAERPKASEG